MSKTWLWTSQNAFLTETDPSTGAAWKDRYGVAFSRGNVIKGNVESYLSYKKLHRTGRLLRSLKIKREAGKDGIKIVLYNTAPYASEQENGGYTTTTTVRGAYTRGGVSGVVLGGNVQARHFMRPSKQVLNAPRKLIEARMKKYGWSKQ